MAKSHLQLEQRQVYSVYGILNCTMGIQGETFHPPLHSRPSARPKIVISQFRNRGRSQDFWKADVQKFYVQKDVLDAWALSKSAILSSAESGPGTAYCFHRECSSHVTTYFRTFVRTFESMLRRGSNRSVPGPRPMELKVDDFGVNSTNREGADRGSHFC